MFILNTFVDDKRTTKLSTELRRLTRSEKSTTLTLRSPLYARERQASSDRDGRLASQNPLVQMNQYAHEQ